MQLAQEPRAQTLVNKSYDVELLELRSFRMQDWTFALYSPILPGSSFCGNNGGAEGICGQMHLVPEVAQHVSPRACDTASEQ